MITKTLSAWLTRIGQPESWLHPKLSQLSDHSLILDRSLVIDRIVKSIRSGKNILCYGDYDCDGMGSTALLVDAIQQMGGRCSWMVASRFGGQGYGLNNVACDKIIESRPDLLVTLDCGSSDHDRLARLQAAGIDVCVVDHHLVPSRPLPGVIGFLNPHRPECESATEAKVMASGGLALSVAGGVAKVLGIKIDTKALLDLCAIATIADVASLTGDCRVLVRYGLDIISQAKRPGIRALMEISKIDVGSFIDARTVSFRLAPGLNAPGRLSDPDIVLDLLLEKDINRARELASTVKEIWDKRRVITEEVTAACIKEIDSKGYSNDPALVIGAEEFGHGIVGISAARIVDTYKVPVAVIGSEGRGSLRGPPGSRLYDALVYSKESLQVFGGHQQAAGVKLDFSNLGTFRHKFCEFFSQNPPKIEDSSQTVNLILNLDLEDNLLTLADQIYWLEPTGQGNPKPVIQTSGIVKQCKHVKGDHLKFDLLLPNSILLPCFKIKPVEGPETLVIGQKVTIQGDLRKNTWNGKTKAEMFVSKIL